MIRLLLDTALERGKCYRLQGTAAANTIFSLYIGNETQKDFIIQMATSGSPANFDEAINYTTTSTLFNSVYVEDHSPLFPSADPVDITEFSLTLDPACATEYCSECFSLEECTDPPNQELVFLQWTNEDDGFGFNYTSLPLIHSLWIKGGLRDDDYSYDEEYFTTSDGRNFPVYVDALKSQSLYINEVPAYIHDAIRLGLVHDTFKINGSLYTKADGGYSPDWNTPNSLMAGVIVKVREQTQDTKNQHC